MPVQEKSGNYLFISNPDTEIEFGDFPDHNVLIYGKTEVPFSTRLLQLFTRRQDQQFSLNFDENELDKIAKVVKRLHSKKMKKTGKLTFNIEKTINAAVIPTKAHPSDVGYDLYSPFEFSLLPGETKLINFHIKIGLEEGYEAQVRNRSGLPAKQKVMLAQCLGTIDPDYRGEIMGSFFNFGQNQQFFKAGSRLAQLVIKRTEENIDIIEGKVYNNTKRGEKGFGSTGV